VTIETLEMQGEYAAKAEVLCEEYSPPIGCNIVIDSDKIITLIRKKDSPKY